MGSANPKTYTGSLSTGAQSVTLGFARDGMLKPLVRFGLGDDKGLAGFSYLAPWIAAADGDQFDSYARPQTPCNFKLSIDLKSRRISAWTASRGDSAFFLLAENALLPEAITSVNHLSIEQHPGATRIEHLIVDSRPWAPGESVRPHPFAKPNRTVDADGGFWLQSMRSLWRNPGRYVVVSRDQNRWQGFADVTSTVSGKLLTTYCDGRAHGGGGKSVMRTSDDGGKTWSPEVVIAPAKGANERLQRLRDGSLLLVIGENVPTAEFKHSTDDGRTWINLGGFDCRDFGLKVHYPQPRAGMLGRFLAHRRIGHVPRRRPSLRSCQPLPYSRAPANLPL